MKSKLRMKRKFPLVSNNNEESQINKRIRVEVNYEPLFRDPELKRLIEQFQSTSKLEVKKLVSLGYNESAAIEKIFNDLFSTRTNKIDNLKEEEEEEEEEERELIKFGFDNSEAKRITTIKKEILRLKKTGKDAKKIVEEFIDKLKRKNRKIRKPLFSNIYLNNNNNNNAEANNGIKSKENNNNNGMDYEDNEEISSPFKRQKWDDDFSSYWEPIFALSDSNSIVDNNSNNNDNNNDNNNNNNAEISNHSHNEDANKLQNREISDSNSADRNKLLQFSPVKHFMDNLQSLVNYKDDDDDDEEDDDDEGHRTVDYFVFDEDEEIDSPNDPSDPFVFSHYDDDDDEDEEEEEDGENDFLLQYQGSNITPHKILEPAFN